MVLGSEERILLEERYLDILNGNDYPGFLLGDVIEFANKRIGGGYKLFGYGPEMKRFRVLSISRLEGQLGYFILAKYPNGEKSRYYNLDSSRIMLDKEIPPPDQNQLLLFEL